MIRKDSVYTHKMVYYLKSTMSIPLEIHQKREILEKQIQLKN